jgi:hypothetical protein
LRFTTIRHLVCAAANEWAWSGLHQLKISRVSDISTHETDLAA